LAEKIAIIGFGGHAVSVYHSAKSQGLEVVGYVDDKPTDRELKGLKYLGTDSDYLKYSEKTSLHICAVGDNSIRRKIQERYESYGLEFVSVIHSSAVIENDVEIGVGVFIGALTYINGNVRIGKGAIINNHCNIEHDCKIGAYAHIAPSTSLSGGVTVQDFCFLGANCTVLPEATIGHNTTVGAGSVVLKSIGSNSIFVGNPAKELKR
jgi:sugar O-acyltransferase (sialic acid O-acetyltransferase NeuD family)